MHGDEFAQYLALDRAKRIAARAGSPDQLAATVAALEHGPTGASADPSGADRGIPSFQYAPSQLTAPSSWNTRSYPHDADFDHQGHIDVIWRTHDSWYDVHGRASRYRLAPDALIRVHHRVTGKTEILTAAEVKALADQHESDATFGKLTVIGVAIGAALIGSSKTLLGKAATALFEVALPAVGQYVVEHEHQIATMAGGPAFLQAWQLFNLGMTGFGIARMASGAGRALYGRVRGTADHLSIQNPQSPIAAGAAAEIAKLDRAMDAARGPARLLTACDNDAQATRLMAALGDAGVDSRRIAGLDDVAAAALRDADRALARGNSQAAHAHLNAAALSPAERAALSHALSRAHGGVLADAVTPAGRPAPKLSDRIPEHRVSRTAGGFSSTDHANQRVRVRRRELEAQYGKDYVDEIHDSEIYAERLYRGQRQTKAITMGEPKSAERLGMEYELAGNKRPMVDMMVEDQHGRLVPTEVKNQTQPNFAGTGDAASKKFAEIARNAPERITDKISHYEIIVHRDSPMPANFKATAHGELWYLVDGTTTPQVWQRWLFGGKPVVVRRGDLGKISR